jgi:hypothetical protein
VLKCPCQLGSAQKSSEVFRCQENGSWQSSCTVLLSINWSYMLIINYHSNAASMLKRPREFTETKKAIMVQVVLDQQGAIPYHQGETSNNCAPVQIRVVAQTIQTSMKD